MCVTWLIHMCVMTRSYLCRVSCLCVLWLIRIRALIYPHVWRGYSHVWHDSFICATYNAFILAPWRIHTCGMAHSCSWHVLFTCVSHVFTCVILLIHTCELTRLYVTGNLFIHATWRIYMCNMTCSCVWYALFICVIWRIHLCDMTYSYVWHDPFVLLTWIFHMCDMTHSFVWNDSFKCMTWLTHMCDMTHWYVCNTLPRSDLWPFTYTRMGWLWLVGSIKLQVSFAKEPYKRDYILQKRPIILSILRTVASPYAHPSYAHNCYKHIYIHTFIVHTHAHLIPI